MSPIQIIVLLIATAFATSLGAQPKDAPQPKQIHNPAKAGYVPPERKQGYAASVRANAAEAAKGTTTPAPNTYNAKLGSVYQMEQSIALAKASGVDPKVIAQSEATLAALRADLAATPKPPPAPVFGTPLK